jgi:hypothetical protein
MPLCEIRTISNQEMCRLRAFHAQGVALKYSWRSWSGVRRHDGVIVFAIAESDVEASNSGCLLPDRAQVASYDTIGLRVEKIAEQYWALWGSVTQSRRPARRATWFDASRLAS